MTVQKILYIRQCPLCEQGLVRPRICHSFPSKTPAENVSSPPIASLSNPNSIAVILCDECDAVWTDPTFRERIRTQIDSDPACPQCHQSLWGPQSHWASLEETYLLGWYNDIQVATLHGDQERADGGTMESDTE